LESRNKFTRPEEGQVFCCFKRRSYTFVVFVIFLLYLIIFSYLSQKSKSEQSVRYRIVVILIESTLDLGRQHHAEICEDEWLYFEYNHDTTVSFLNASRVSARMRTTTQSNIDVAVHLSVHISRYSGSLYVRTTRGYAPIKLVPPYTFLSEGDHDVTINICDGIYLLIVATVPLQF